MQIYMHLMNMTTYLTLLYKKVQKQIDKESTIHVVFVRIKMGRILSNWIHFHIWFGPDSDRNPCILSDKDIEADKCLQFCQISYIDLDRKVLWISDTVLDIQLKKQASIMGGKILHTPCKGSNQEHHTALNCLVQGIANHNTPNTGCYVVSVRDQAQIAQLRTKPSSTAPN